MFYYLLKLLGLSYSKFIFKEILRNSISYNAKPKYKVANRAESRCSGLRSRGKLEQHVTCHYLVEMSDCDAAQAEPRTDGEFRLCTEWRLIFADLN